MELLYYCIPETLNTLYTETTEHCMLTILENNIITEVVTYIYAMEYYSVIKKNYKEILPFVTQVLR